MHDDNKIMNGRAASLSPGTRALDFVLPGQNGTPTRFYGKFGGTPVVLLFDHASHDGAPEELLRLSEFLAHRPPEQVAALAINRETTAANLQTANHHGLTFPVLSDTEGKVGGLYGIGQGEAMVLLLDANLRVVTAFDMKETESWPKRIESWLDALPRIDPIEISSPAPVLLIPNVLDLAFCDLLINVWGTLGNVDTGIEHSRAGGRELSLDSAEKRRRDHTVTDRELLRLITSKVGRIVIPEIQRAFAFRATRFEGFKIACYDAASRGHFHAHRDNLSPATAHRRFALTLNLNEGYEGGHLRFPEYGPHLYRPRAGGAIVFSCSLLHEATEVTQGQRYVLLSFLFGEGDLRHSQRTQEVNEPTGKEQP